MSQVDRQIAARAARQHGVVARWQLRNAGVGAKAIERRVADRRLRGLHRGVYAFGQVPITRPTRWMAAVLALGRDAALSHHDAAAALDLRKPPNGRIHVTAPRSRRQRRGLVVHQGTLLRPDDVSVVNAIPVTSLPRTLLDMAAVLEPIELQRMWERAERLEVLDVRAVKTLLDRANGHRGIAPLRALLGCDPRTAAQAESELERLFLDLVREAGLPMPQVNVLVEGFLVDAYWPQSKLVVELDGYEFHSDREAFERDHRKHVRLRSAGYAFLAFTYRQIVEEHATVIATVRRELLG
jgi:very-short-patch-repair endonuclease